MRSDDTELAVRNYWLEFGATTKVEAPLFAGSSLHNVPATGEMTVECVVKIDRDEAQADEWAAIVEKGNIITAGWWIAVNTDNYLEFRVNLDGGAALSTAAAEIPDYDLWYHIVGYYNNTTKLARLAINGSWEASGTGAGSPPDDSVPVESMSASSLCSGMAWLAVFDTDIYNGAAGIDFTPIQSPPRNGDTGLVECWVFGHDDVHVRPVAEVGNAAEVTGKDFRQGWYDDPLHDMTDLRDAVGDPIYDVIIEQYSPSYTTHTGTPAVATNGNSDTIVCDDTLVHVWSKESIFDADRIYVSTLADEQYADQTWSATTWLAAPGIGFPPTDPTITVATNNTDTVRIFFWDNTNLKYFENTAKGVGDTASWGAAQTIVAKADVKLLAATDLLRLHYATLTGSNNVRLACLEYEGAAWVDTSSGTYWHEVPDSFDAVAGPARDMGAQTTNDILVFSTTVPPTIGRKLSGLTTIIEVTPVEAIVLIRYQNKHWSDHYVLDQIDDPATLPSRTGVRISRSNDWCILTYTRITGTSYYETTRTAMTRSWDGLRWEHPYLITNYPYGVALRQNLYDYIVTTGGTMRSPACNYFGEAGTHLDLTPRMLQIQQSITDITQLNCVVANPEQVLSSSLLFEDVQLQAKLGLGYWVSDGALSEGLGVQTGVFDIDVVAERLTMPVDQIQIAAAGELGRMTRIRADEPQEWDGQRMGADDFNDPDATDYGGLRHTALLTGTFETPVGDYLETTDDDTECVAFSTYMPDAWNGSIQSGIYITDGAGASEYVGVVFRAYDENNLYAVWYDVFDDKLRLIDRRNGVDSTLWTLPGTMSWSSATWYYLKVIFRYDYVQIYTSTDGQTFTHLQSQELGGATTVFNWTNYAAKSVPCMSGRTGYISYCETNQGARWKESFVNDHRQNYSLEDSIRLCATYAGVHKFDYEKDVDEEFDGGLGDWSLDADAVWTDTDEVLWCTAGAAAIFYQGRYTEVDIPPGFIASFDFVSGTEAGFFFRGKDGASDCICAWWKAATCGFSTIDAARAGTIITSMPYGVSTGSRLQVAAKWKLDSADESRKWLLMSLYVDGVLYVSASLNVGGTAFDWDGDWVGFGTWSGLTAKWDNLEIQQLHRIVDYTSIDPDENPVAGMSRAVGTTRLRISDSWDGTMRVRQSTNISGGWTIPDSRVQVYQSRYDKQRTANHVRMIGAVHSVDVIAEAVDCEANMHRFVQIDDPNIWSEDECRAEAWMQIWDAQEGEQTGALQMPMQPLAEGYDLVYYDSNFWRTVGVKHNLSRRQRGAARPTSVLDLRDYISRRRILT